MNDYAGILDSYSEKAIGDFLQQIKDQGGSHVAVLTVPDMQGLTIEEFSIKVTDSWKLGSEKNDNGVLLLIAMKERAIRIEVGQGLEGDLTDLHSKRIIDDTIVPEMRKGNYLQAVERGLSRIFEYTDPGVMLGGKITPTKKSSRSNSNPIFHILIISVFLALKILGLSGRRRRRGSSLRNSGADIFFGGGGGSFGGGSGGFGGFGGGGGGFSGGGASGRW